MTTRWCRPRMQLPARVRRSALLLAFLIPSIVFGALLTGTSRARAEAREEYIDALRHSGFADLAIDYLKMQLEKPGLSNEEKGSLEFDIAAVLIDQSENAPDLSTREQMLEEARRQFDLFVKNYPQHSRLAESLAELGTIELQKGRMRVLQAQLPANSARTLELAKEARELLSKAAKSYAAGFDRFKEEYKQYPVFIDDAKRGAREVRAKRNRVFQKLMDARFQGALSQFYLADSYLTIDLPEVDKDDKNAAAERTLLKAQWDIASKNALDKAEALFDEIHVEYRQWPVGQIAYLWKARCLAAKGDHRKARGIFKVIMDHEDIRLAPLQRLVFWFDMLSTAAQRDFDNVIARAEEWLKKNRRFRESSVLGVEYELAMAYVGRGKESASKTRIVDLNKANDLFERLSAKPNEYQGLARREQLKIEPLLQKDPKARTFQQFYSRATAQLDLIRPDTSPEEKKKLLGGAKKLLRQALDAVKPHDDLGDVANARLQLLYAHMEANELYEAVIVGEYIARYMQTTAPAPTSALYGVQAYARAFDEALAIDQQYNGSAEFQVDADRLQALVAHMNQRWPRHKETDQARMIAGQLCWHPAIHDRPKAAQWFEQMHPDGALAVEGNALAGQVYWEWYRALSSAASEDPKTRAELRDKAIQRLSRAVEPLRKSRTKIDQLLFATQAMLGEAYYDLGDDAKALVALAPLVTAVEKGLLPADIPPEARISTLLTALQCRIRLNKVDDKETQAIIELLGKQRGQEKVGNITLVFIGLAARIKEQVDRLKADNELEKHARTVEAFESFLESIGRREEGQTVQSLVYLGDLFVQLGKPHKAVLLLERASQHADAQTEECKPFITKARLLQARCQSQLEEHDQAIAAINALLKDNPQALDVMMTRGEILVQAAKINDAIAHWKWMINRLKNVAPRPRDFYVALQKLAETNLRVEGKERPMRLSEGRRLLLIITQTDRNLPVDLRDTFNRLLKEIEKELGE